MTTTTTDPVAPTTPPETGKRAKGLHVLFDNLPSELRDAIVSIHADRGLGDFSVFLRRSYRHFVYSLGIPCLALACTVIWGIARSPGAPLRESWWQLALVLALVLLALVFGLVVCVDLVRGFASQFKPFFLLTPTTIVRADLSHHPMHIYRLADATGFQSSDQYSRASWTGRLYTFTFGDETVTITIKNQDTVQAFENVLELARAKGRGEELPDCPATRAGDLYPRSEVVAHESTILGQVLNPVSMWWITVGALLVLGGVVALIVAAVLGKI